MYSGNGICQPLGSGQRSLVVQALKAKVRSSWERWGEQWRLPRLPAKKSSLWRTPIVHYSPVTHHAGKVGLGKADLCQLGFSVAPGCVLSSSASPRSGMQSAQGQHTALIGWPYRVTDRGDDVHPIRVRHYCVRPITVYQSSSILQSLPRGKCCAVPLRRSAAAEANLGGAVCLSPCLS
jgi:hypothetical protein